MYQKEKVDNRVKYTREWTYMALEKLLISNKYSEITITEIIEKSGISRATFYRNFSSKDDIIAFKVKTFFNDFYDELMSHFKMMNTSSEFDLIERFFTAAHNNSALLDTVIKSNQEYLMILSIAEVINYHKDLFYSLIQTDKKAEKYIIDIVSSSAWTLLSSWFKGGQVESPKELTRIYLFTFESVYLALYGNKEDLNNR